MMVDVMNANVFSLGRKKANMLGALDAICLNSWGEWQCHRFEGDTAVLQALAFVTPGLRRASLPVDMDVISCSQKLRPQLKLAVKNLLKQTMRLCQQVQQSDQSRQSQDHYLYRVLGYSYLPVPTTGGLGQVRIGC